MKKSLTSFIAIFFISAFNYANAPAISTLISSIAIKIDVKGPLYVNIEDCDGRFTWKEAQKACNKLVTEDGTSDWRLPTKEELNAIFLHKSTIGGFRQTFYWSATEKSNPYAYAQVFNNGTLTAAGKANRYKCRCVKRK